MGNPIGLRHGAVALEPVRQKNGFANTAPTVDNNQRGLIALGFLSQLGQFAGATDELHPIEIIGIFGSLANLQHGG